MSSIVLHSGNIASRIPASQSPLSTPAEISTGLSISINNLASGTKASPLTASLASDPSRCLPRELLQVSAKIFLNSSVSTSDLAVKQIDAAVTSTLTALPYAEAIDILFVNFSCEFGLASHFRTVWEYLESLVENKKVKSLGVVDLTSAQLTELLSFAKVAPSVNQIALKDVTSDLLQFSKSNNIELCARPSSDSDVDLSAIDSSSISGSAPLSLSWTLRYSVTAKHQHLLLTKGYLYGLSAVEETKKAVLPVDVAPAAILSH